MDTTVAIKPKTMAELLPSLGGLFSKNAMQAITLTATKKPRQTIANTLTSEKVMKPMTIAEMRNEVRSLKLKSPKHNVQATTSVKKKWNSSCKLENKTVSRTANGLMKNNSVRKALNFQQPKSKVPKSFTNSRMTIMNSETPKFLKPEIKAKKSIPLQARNAVRISGVYNIVDTPSTSNKPMKNKMAIYNKENIPNDTHVSSHKKLITTPKSILRKRVMASLIPNTPLSNESWKSSDDASFLQNEQNIENFERKTKALEDESTLDNIEQVTPPVSTPFMDYRNIKDFFNNSSDVKDDACHNDTIMSFNNTVTTENVKREESVIVSLCDMLKKSAVSNTDKHSTELDDLLEVQKQIMHNIKMVDNGIRTLNNIKESELKSLHYVNKFIQEKQNQQVSENNENITATKETPNKNKSNTDNDIKPLSVIKTNQNSPSYKIPKKYTGLRNKVFHKSMPNISGGTPHKDMNEKALSMYMKIKEQNNFLSTPLVKQRERRYLEVPDTLSKTSHNLQMQLDKLYN